MGPEPGTDHEGRRASALVVMGVSGSGKSTVGRRLAAALAWDYLDADDFHPPANVALMSAGRPLTDAHRDPWLSALADALARRLAEGRGVVLACSALRRAHRDRLRAAGPGVAFLYLRTDPAAARERVAARTGHFFPAALVGSQFAALEEPDPADEPDVIVVDAGTPPEAFTRAWAARRLAELAGS